MKFAYDCAKLDLCAAARAYDNACSALMVAQCLRPVDEGDVIRDAKAKKDRTEVDLLNTALRFARESR